MDFLTIRLLYGVDDLVPLKTSTTTVVTTVVTGTLLTLATFLLLGSEMYSGIPLVGGVRGLFAGRKTKKEWNLHASKVIADGLQKCKGMFQVLTDTGPTLILPPRFIDEIKNHKKFNFSKFVDRSFFPHYPGFDGFAGTSRGQIPQNAIRIQLTQSLGRITQALSDETADSLPEVFPVPSSSSDTDWQSCPSLLTTSTRLVARLSARVFLGPVLCRNQDWLDISREYTYNSFAAARELRRWPAVLRPIVHWFLPECRLIRQQVATARALIQPEVEARRAENAAIIARGEKPEKALDAIGWLEETRKDKPFDVALGQLGFAIAAIHTTSTMLTNVIFDLICNPDLTQDLRNEVVNVLQEDGGWKKTSLYKMKLLDSVLKETQRFNPVGAIVMNRVMDSDVVLSDGTKLPQGAHIAVPTTPHFDDATYDSPHEFRGDRFLKMRSKLGEENRWQFVTTSPDHLGFGHGNHACPGRFFASNELKVALAHMIVKYDWRWNGQRAPGREGRPKNIEISGELLPDPEAGVEYRRREAEMEL